jgi:copper transport protein
VSRRVVATLIAVASALLAYAPAASAHALLERTTPARGVTVKNEPGQVVFGFSEPVETSFGAVRVFDGTGKRVDEGDVTRPAGSASVGIKLKPDLADGSYTATYRVISADSHPVSGGFVFSIGAPGDVSKSVSELTAESDVGTATDVAFGIARGITYGAIAVAIGTFVFLLAVWLRAQRHVSGAEQEWLNASRAFAGRTRRLMAIALAVGLVGELLQLVLQGATAAGVSFWSALDKDVIQDVLQTRFGTVHALAAGVFASALIVFTARDWVPALRPATVGTAGLAPADRVAGVELALVGALFGFLVLSPALSGHASSQDPSALLIPVDVLHVVAMSVWVGGLVALVFAVPAATRALATRDRTRLLAAVLLRFSPLALACVATLLVTGLLQTYVHVRSLDNLLDTRFGVMVMIKFGLLLALIGFGFYNRNRAIPRLRKLADEGASPGETGISLRRSLLTEIGIFAIVLGVTAALVSYPPPVSTASSGPFSAKKNVGPLEMQVTVDPAKLGSNEMHLYMFRSSDGRQFTGTKELRVTITQVDKGIGPLPVRAQKAGPGHYVMPATDFGAQGDWQVRIVDRVSQFDQYETTVKVPIR